MITVSIDINGRPVLARSARNVTAERGFYHKTGFDTYHCDDGNIIYHKRSDGASVLAKKCWIILKNLKVLQMFCH